jgi:hypothetical protein
LQGSVSAEYSAVPLRTEDRTIKQKKLISETANSTPKIAVLSYERENFTKKNEIPSSSEDKPYILSRECTNNSFHSLGANKTSSNEQSFDGYNSKNSLETVPMISHSIDNILMSSPNPGTHGLPFDLHGPHETQRTISPLDSPVRKNNYQRDQCIVVKGIPESNNSKPVDQIKDDISVFQSCALSILNDGESIAVIRAFRLGKNASDLKPRPLKIVLENSTQADLLLNRKHLLSTHHRNVFFQRDYPPKERQKYRELYKELMLRRSNGELNLKIRGGKIIYTRQYWDAPLLIRKVNM